MSDITEYYLLKNDTVSFWVLDTEIELFQSDTAYGVQTVAIVHGVIVQNETYYLNELPITLETAVNIWQDLNNRLLTNEEWSEVLKDNNLTSSAV